MKRWKIIGAVVLLAVLISASFILKSHKTTGSSDDNREVPKQSVSDPKTGVTFNYLSPLNSQTVSAQDMKDKIVIRLTSSSPAMLITVKYEDGLQAVAALTHQEPIDIILSNAAKAFPVRFKDYAEVSQRKFKLANNDAAEIIFTYTGPNKSTAKQRLVIVLKDTNTAVYVTAQSEANEFESVNSTYFDGIFNSISFK